VNISRFQHELMPRFTQIVYVFSNPQFIAESVLWESEGSVSKNHGL
jgi:Gpi18-like mannosyltransferase